MFTGISEDVVFDEQQTEEQAMDAYKKNSVDGAIIQPYLPRIYMEDHVRIHDRIYEMTKCKEKKVLGDGVYQPPLQARRV